ncbi:MAG: DUF2130 domain-containing protein [Deltaproteobacteria bacterium]
MENNIRCPRCDFEFPVEKAFIVKAEEKLRSDYERKLAQQLAIFNKQKTDLEKEKEEFEKKKERENGIFLEKLEKKLSEEREKIKKSTNEEFEMKFKLLEEENAQKARENRELKQKELEILRREALLKEQQDQMNIEFERKLLEKRDQISEEVRKIEQQRNDLRIKEYEKKLDDQKKLIDEMQRKAQQGSMQLQGEVYELILEELLKNEFPFDLIDEVPKGVRGADLIHTVIDNNQECGRIIYESKRTKNFSESWIQKLKDDQREHKALISVLVSEVLPKGIEGFGFKDGIWICSFSELKQLAFVLRQMIVREQNIKSMQSNKGDKMELLYNYLTSDDFRHRVEAIVEGFSILRNDIEKEKRAMQRIWKEREKQIDRVIDNTIDMYGSIRGIAGNAISPVQALELAEPEYPDNE